MAPRNKTIDWTHLAEGYRGKWVVLADDLRTVVGVGDTAKQALERADNHAARHFLYQVPATLDLFAGYAI